MLEPSKLEETKEEKEAKPLLSTEESRQLLNQVEAEYTVSKNSLTALKKEWGRRLKLFNNQRKDPSGIGDPLLYTVFMTVLASIYQDQMIVEWMGFEEGDDQQAENLNHVAKYDFDEMQKSIVDYVWDWDSLFFGRGMIEFVGYDRKTLTPEIKVIDPFSFYRDPNASAFNDSPIDKGCRFWGEDIEVTAYQIDKSKYTDKDKIKMTDMKIDTDMEQARRARNEAQNIEETRESDDFGDNKRYQLIKWHTHFKGKKCLVVVTNDFENIVKYTVLKNQDMWLAVDRPSSMMSRSWDGVSIPDLLEDKQRARAIVQNVNYKAIQNSLFTHYLYNPDKITNPKDLDFGINKKVPTSKGDPAGAVLPMPKDKADINAVDYIMNSLDEAAQRATATPETQQGVTTDQQRTLGELNLVASRVGVRYSLTARVFGISEKNFWKIWYWMYKIYMKDTIDKKIVQLRSAFGGVWKAFTKDDLVSAKSDPNLLITSKILSEDKRDRELTRFRIALSLTAQYPGTNLRYAYRKLYKLIGYRTEEINKLQPPTADEMLAEEENDLLTKNKKTPVSPTDDHIAHIEIHERAKLTKATTAHIETHKAAIALQKQKPELFPNLAQNNPVSQEQEAPSLGTEMPGNISQAVSMQ